MNIRVNLHLRLQEYGDLVVVNVPPGHTRFVVVHIYEHILEAYQSVASAHRDNRYIDIEFRDEYSVQRIKPGSHVRLSYKRKVFWTDRIVSIDPDIYGS